MDGLNILVDMLIYHTNDQSFLNYRMGWIEYIDWHAHIPPQ